MATQAIIQENCTTRSGATKGAVFGGRDTDVPRLSSRPYATAAVKRMQISPKRQTRVSQVIRAPLLKYSPAVFDESVQAYVTRPPLFSNSIQVKLCFVNHQTRTVKAKYTREIATLNNSQLNISVKR